jgi:outer membrane protein assembly factor BamB
MSTTKTTKWLIGAATAWLLAYPVFFIIIWLLSFRSMFLGSTDFPFAEPFFSYLLPLHCLTAILQFVLLAFYLIHIIRNPSISEAWKVALALSIFILSFIGMPGYYYLFIWREHPPRWALPPAVRAQPPDPTQVQVPAQPLPWRKWLPVAIVAGLAIAVFAAAMVTAAAVLPSVIGVMRQGFSEPEPPRYTQLSQYSEIGGLRYQPAPSEYFQYVTSFSGVRTWRYTNRTPLAIQGENLLVAGQFAPDARMRTTVDLVAADLNDGHVLWQAIAGDNFLATDADRAYFPSGRDPFTAVSIVAVDIRSGEQLWEAPLDYENAIGVEYLALVDDTLGVRTYLRGNGAFYALDPSNGHIITAVKEPNSIVAMSRGQTTEWFGDTVVVRGPGGWTARLTTDRALYDRDLGPPLVLNDTIVVQNGYYAAAPVSALSRADGSLLWEYSGTSASNLAATAGRVLFLTEDGELVALNSSTGELIASLSFEPSLPSDYDFANDALIVAAQGEYVAVYFGDAEQLTILRLIPQ